MTDSIFLTEFSRTIRFDPFHTNAIITKLAKEQQSNGQLSTGGNSRSELFRTSEYNTSTANSSFANQRNSSAYVGPACAARSFMQQVEERVTRFVNIKTERMKSQD